jgi:hypothetical protein
VVGRNRVDRIQRRWRSRCCTGYCRWVVLVLGVLTVKILKTESWDRNVAFLGLEMIEPTNLWQTSQNYRLRMVYSNDFFFFFFLHVHTIGEENLN